MKITETKVITLNSINAVEVSNPTFMSDVRFNFPSVVAPEENILYNTFSIQSGTFPFSFYNVNELNDKLVINIGGSDLLMTIPEGNYNTSNLAATFKGLFTSLTGSNVAFVLDAKTGVYSLTSLTENETITIKHAGSTSFRVFGLRAGQDKTFSYNTANPTSFDFPANLLGAKKIQVYSSALSGHNLDSKTLGANSLLGTIPINAPVFGLITFDLGRNNETVIKNPTVNAIDIQLKDEYDNFIDFNSTDWALTIIIKTYRRQSYVMDRNFESMLTTKMEIPDPPVLKRSNAEPLALEKYEDDELEALLDNSDLSNSTQAQNKM